jgi:hypothetical protein
LQQRLSLVHVTPHAPQLAEFESRSISYPSPGFRLQSPQRPAHARLGGQHAPLSMTLLSTTTPASITLLSMTTPESVGGVLVSVTTLVSFDASGCVATSSDGVESIDDPPSLVDASRSRVGTVVHDVAAKSASSARDDEGRVGVMPLDDTENFPAKRAVDY